MRSMGGAAFSMTIEGDAGRLSDVRRLKSCTVEPSPLAGMMGGLAKKDSRGSCLGIIGSRIAIRGSGDDGWDRLQAQRWQ